MDAGLKFVEDFIGQYRSLAMLILVVSYRVENSFSAVYKVYIAVRMSRWCTRVLRSGVVDRFGRRIRIVIVIEIIKIMIINVMTNRVIFIIMINFPSILSIDTINVVSHPNSKPNPNPKPNLNPNPNSPGLAEIHRM